MATKQIDDLIDNDLNDKHKDAMFELQFGKPDFLLDEKLINELDERDLVNRIQYTSVRSNEAVMGYALSERGNQVVEEIRRRNQRVDTAVPTPPGAADTKDTNDTSKKDSDKS